MNIKIKQKSQSKSIKPKSLLNNLKKNIFFDRIWDEIQLRFECCGIHSPKDWATVIPPENITQLPMSCCKRKIGSIGNVSCTMDKEDDTRRFNNGCLDEFGNFIRGHAVSLGAAGIIIAFIQVISMKK